MEEHYKIGYALSGGFIRGFAHLGAMQALYENDIKPEIISGVSAGAIAGVLCADGKEPYEALEFFLGKTFGDFTKVTMKSGGLMSLSLFLDFLRSSVSVKNIEQLRLPLVVTATNLDKGRSVSFRSGEIAPRIAASCCVPGLFTPINIDGEHYVDGGVFLNLPVVTIRDICDEVIAVNVSQVVADEYKMNMISVLLRAYHFMSHSNIMHDRNRADVLIEPAELYDYSNSDLDKAKEIFDKGYKEAKRIIESRNR